MRFLSSLSNPSKDHKNIGKRDRGKAERDKFSWMNNFSTQGSKDRESSQMRRGDDLVGSSAPVIGEEPDFSLKGQIQVCVHEVPGHSRASVQGFQKSHKVHPGADSQALKKRHEVKDVRNQIPSRKRSMSFSDQVQLEGDFLRVRKGVVRESVDGNLASIEFRPPEKTPENIFECLGKVDVDQNGRMYRSKFSIGFTSINVLDSYSNSKKCSKVILPDPPKSGILCNLNKQDRNEVTEKAPSDIPVEKAPDPPDIPKESESASKQTVSESSGKNTALNPKVQDSSLGLTSKSQQNDPKIEPQLAKDQAAQQRQPASAPMNHPSRGYYMQSPYMQPMGGSVIIQTSSILEQQRFQKHQSPTIASDPQDPMFLHSLSRMQHHTSYVDNDDQHLYYQNGYPGYISHRDNIIVPGKKRDQPSLLRMNGRISPARIIHPETMELLVTPMPEEARISATPKGKSILATHESKPILIRHPDTKEEIKISDLIQRNMKSATSAQSTESSPETLKPAIQDAPQAAVRAAPQAAGQAAPQTAEPVTQAAVQAAPQAAVQRAPQAAVQRALQPAEPAIELVEIIEVPAPAAELPAPVELSAELSVSEKPARLTESASEKVRPTESPAHHERKDKHPMKQRQEIRSKEVKPKEAKSKEIKPKEVAAKSKDNIKPEKSVDSVRPSKEVRGTKHFKEDAKIAEGDTVSSRESAAGKIDVNESRKGDANAARTKLERTEDMHLPQPSKGSAGSVPESGLQNTPKAAAPARHTERAVPVAKAESKSDSQTGSSRSGSRVFSGSSSSTVNEVIQMFESRRQESEPFARKSAPGSDPAKKVSKSAKDAEGASKSREQSEPQKEAAVQKEPQAGLKPPKSETKQDMSKVKSDTSRKDIPTIKIVADIPRKRAPPDNDDLESGEIRERIRITDFSQLEYPSKVIPPKKIDGKYVYSIDFFNAIKDACMNLGSSLDMTCMNCNMSQSSPPHTNLQCFLKRTRNTSDSHSRMQKYSHGAHTSGSMGGSGRHAFRGGQNVQVYGIPRSGKGRDSHSQMGADRPRKDSEIVLNQSENAWKPHYQNQFRESFSNKADSTEYMTNKIRGLLNKVTMVNIDYVVQSIYQLGDVTNEDYLGILVNMIFEKTLSEPAFCFIYAKLCLKLSDMFTSVAGREKDKPTALRKLILERCQQEFQKTSRWAVESKIVSDQIKEARLNVDSLTSDEKQKLAEKEYEQVVIKGRSLGNVKFVGELYKNNLIAEKVMYSCITHLLKYEDDPEEEKIESLFQLLSTIGGLLERNGPNEELDKSFKQIKALLDSKKLCQRIKFMLMDVIDLRANNWVNKKAEIKEPKPETRDQGGYGYYHHDSEGQSNRFGGRDRGPMGRSHNQYHMGSMRDMSKSRGSMQTSTRNVLETGDYGKFTLDASKHKPSDDLHLWPEICGKERQNNSRKLSGNQGMQSRADKFFRPEPKGENAFMYNHLSKDDIAEEVKEGDIEEYLKKRDSIPENQLSRIKEKARRIISDWVESKSNTAISEGLREEGGNDPASTANLQMIFLSEFMKTLLDLKMDDMVKGFGAMLELYSQKCITNKLHYINAIYGILDEFEDLCSDLPALPGIIGTFIGKCLSSDILSSSDFEKTKEKYKNIFKDSFYENKIGEGIAQTRSTGAGV